MSPSPGPTASPSLSVTREHKDRMVVLHLNMGREPTHPQARVTDVRDFLFDVATLAVAVSAACLDKKIGTYELKALKSLIRSTTVNVISTLESP